VGIVKTGLVVVGGLAGGVAALGVVFVVGMRRKVPVVLRAVRRSGRAMRPVLLRSAGRPGSSIAVIEHVGRRSGRRYDTPVSAVPFPGGFAIALPYGLTADWLANVLHAGRATIRVDGAEHAVVRPEVVDIDDVSQYFPLREQRQHRQFSVRQALRVHTQEPGAAAPASAAEAAVSPAGASRS
jgi:deazaflavin-dependent oxidoreductase (nitroreductase family)